MESSIFKKYRVALWTGSIGLVVVVGLNLVRHEYPELSFWESLYRTLELFVFDLGLPSFPKNRFLTAIVFIAPLITASVLGTALTYLFRISPGFKSRWMSDHIVICGVGRTGKLLAEILKDNNVPVVGVDIGPPEAFDEWCARTRVPIIYGDFHSGLLLQKAGAKRARAIIFASGNDLANLEGAFGAYERLRRKDGPVQLIWTHIADENLANTARLAIRTVGVVNIRIFDTYNIAATRMIEMYFPPEKRKDITEINLIGFGKFGRDLFEILVRNMQEDKNFKIRVIDRRDCKNTVFALADELGVAERVSFEMAMIQEMKMQDGTNKAYFLCTDDDLGNISAALLLVSKTHKSHIFVRMTHWPLSATADHLGEDRGVVFVNINDLVVKGIENLPGIFERAGASDLKRLKDN